MTASDSHVPITAGWITGASARSVALIERLTGGERTRHARPQPNDDRTN